MLKGKFNFFLSILQKMLQNLILWKSDQRSCGQRNVGKKTYYEDMLGSQIVIFPKFYDMCLNAKIAFKNL